MTTTPIALLLDSRRPGGIESHVLALARGLLQRGQPVEVVFLADHGPHPLRDALTAGGIPNHSLNGRVVGLWRYLRRRRPALVHTHGYKAGILGRLLARLCRLPCISTCHAGETPRGALAWYDRLDRLSAPLADRVLAVSPAIAAKVPGPVIVQDNFIDCRGLKMSDGEQIAYVGRLSEEKGPDRLLPLANALPQLTFHCYGDGPLRSSLEASAPANLVFHGQQDNMATVWPKVALLLMPSRHEGLPMAALEAMARGIPLIASDVGALPTLIEHRTNGWLLPSGDLTAFARTLTQWQTLAPDQQATIRQRAAATVKQRFASDRQLPALLELYRQLIKRQCPR